MLIKLNDGQGNITLVDTRDHTVTVNVTAGPNPKIQVKTFARNILMDETIKGSLSIINERGVSLLETNAEKLKEARHGSDY